jgi:hypothetical protein
MFRANHGLQIPKYEVLSPEMVNDAFCDTLAKHCPQVERLVVWEVIEGLNEHSIEQIQAFTDRGLLVMPA